MDVAVPLMQVLPSPPITRDQYAMLKAGNTAPNDAARAAFDLPMLRLQDRLPLIVKR
jgi:NADH dehydrogenase